MEAGAGSVMAGPVSLSEDVIRTAATTAGVTINENADPSVVRDMLAHLEKLVPEHDGFTHGEGNSDSHIKASMMGASVTIPIMGGRLALGTWQGIYFCEFDGPRNRRCVISIVESSK